MENVYNAVSGIGVVSIVTNVVFFCCFCMAFSALRASRKVKKSVITFRVLGIVLPALLFLFRASLLPAYFRMREAYRIAMTNNLTSDVPLGGDFETLEPKTSKGLLIGVEKGESTAVVTVRCVALNPDDPFFEVVATVVDDGGKIKVVNYSWTNKEKDKKTDE